MTKSEQNNAKKTTTKRNRHYDKDTAIALALNGASQREISNKLNISRHTASKLITKINAIRHQLDTYRDQKSDIYSYLHSEATVCIAEGLTAIRNQLEGHNKGENELKPSQISQLTDKACVAFDRIFYQERLNDNKSTQNAIVMPWDQATSKGDQDRKLMYQAEVLDEDTTNK